MLALRFIWIKNSKKRLMAGWPIGDNGNGWRSETGQDEKWRWMIWDMDKKD